jgi:hypothetical protein
MNILKAIVISVDIAAMKVQLAEFILKKMLYSHFVPPVSAVFIQYVRIGNM